eukprot:UN17277
MPLLKYLNEWRIEAVRNAFQTHRWFTLCLSLASKDRKPWDTIQALFLSLKLNSKNVVLDVSPQILTREWKSLASEYIFSVINANEKQKTFFTHHIGNKRLFYKIDNRARSSDELNLK